MVKYVATQANLVLSLRRPLAKYNYGLIALVLVWILLQLTLTKRHYFRANTYFLKTGVSNQNRLKSFFKVSYNFAVFLQSDSLR